ncbi:Enoyl-CoA hydratase, mitochondrial [Pseudomonas reidholzensis]|uniref:Enoyl-CoA hydratase, mitochondrial n=1 Tax=Pseudomonas reidholzensis TaxID=1785162 RepID=A0A383RUX1_9PSED|nr:enoyl-CoA hydratase [Pseudomonas reidholzensis]SYX90849.1 Enoyl-CoA hydratase, mitochondrial [Pseudomonas reidholzensis]
MSNVLAEVVTVTVQDDRVALVRINRPEAKNALNGRVREALARVFRELAVDPAVRAVVLTGGPECFVAGADVREFAEATPVQMYERHAERLWQAISQCPKPVIAAVNGFALGGGCELAMHCDVIIAGRQARFGQPEVKLGLMPGAGGTQRLIRAVGKFQAMRMLLSGCLVPAEQALAMGMVSEVVDDPEVLARALAFGAELAALPRLAVEQIKEVALLGAEMPLDGALALERKAFQLLFDSADQKEGAQAFLDKRRAQFRGE